MTASEPTICTLGFTGHRTLQHPDLIKEQLTECLAKLKEDYGELETISSVASGADTLFLEAAETLGLPCNLILPFDIERFQWDFSPPDWARAKHHLTRATQIQIVEPCDDDPEAYLQAGILTVKGCDILLAVLDSTHVGSKGGTSDVVNYARSHLKPLLVLDPATGELKQDGTLPKSR